MRKRFLLSVSLLWTTQGNTASNKLVDCSYISPKTTECMPYPSKFMYPKNLSTGKEIDFHKPHRLIISKSVPSIEKPKIMNIISVEDMIEKHMVILKQSRFAEVNSHSPIKFATIEDNITQETNTTVVQEKYQDQIGDFDHIDTFVPQQYREMIEIKEQEESKKPLIKISKKYPKYTIKKRDTLGKIAKKFKLTIKEILRVNVLGRGGRLLRVGQKINIPLSKYKVTKILKKVKRAKRKSRKTLNEYGKKLVSTMRGKHTLRVQATAYTSHGSQTDKTPFLAAWNNRIRPGMKIIAVSRDLIYKYGLGNGKRVKIQGLPGHFTVRDKMNKRYTKRIDIYMGLNRRKALRWGRRRTVIYW